MPPSGGPHSLSEPHPASYTPALMDLHFVGPLAGPEERAAVDAFLDPVLGPATSGWDGGERDVEIDGRIARGGHEARSHRHLLLPTLHAIQDRLGWITQPALNYACRRLTIPPADAYGVATFYSLFSTTREACEGRPRLRRHGLPRRWCRRPLRGARADPRSRRPPAAGCRCHVDAQPLPRPVRARAGGAVHGRGRPAHPLLHGPVGRRDGARPPRRPRGCGPDRPRRPPRHRAQPGADGGPAPVHPPGRRSGPADPRPRRPHRPDQPHRLPRQRRLPRPARGHRRRPRPGHRGGHHRRGPGPRRRGVPRRQEVGRRARDAGLAQEHRLQRGRGGARHVQGPGDPRGGPVLARGGDDDRRVRRRGGVGLRLPARRVPTGRGAPPERHRPGPRARPARPGCHGRGLRLRHRDPARWRRVRLRRGHRDLRVHRGQARRAAQQGGAFHHRRPVPEADGPQQRRDPGEHPGHRARGWRHLRGPWLARVQRPQAVLHLRSRQPPWRLRGGVRHHPARPDRDGGRRARRPWRQSREPRRGRGRLRRARSTCTCR